MKRVVVRAGPRGNAFLERRMIRREVTVHDGTRRKKEIALVSDDFKGDLFLLVPGEEGEGRKIERGSVGGASARGVTDRADVRKGGGSGSPSDRKGMG